MPFAVALDLHLEEFDELRAFRSWTDQTHLAPEDVDELRQFVQRRRPQDLPDLGAPVDTLDATRAAPDFNSNLASDSRTGRMVRNLRQPKAFSVAAHTRLAEEDRSRRASA